MFFEVGKNLEYEYSLIFSWLVVLVIPAILNCLPIRYYEEAHQKIAFKSKYLLLLFGFIACFVASIIVGIILFIFDFCKCSVNEYWIWQIINSIPAIVLSLSICLVISSCQEKYSRKKIFFGLGFFYFVSILDLVFWLWFFPQKRISHFVFGFLHGPIYDRFLPIDAGIFFIRFSHILLSLTVASSLISLVYKKNKIFPLILLASYLVSNMVAANYPSVGQGTARLKKVLPETYHEDGFTIHYSTAKNDENLNAVRNLIVESRFHLAELKEILEIKKSSQIHIFVYPSSQIKKLAFGGGGTDVTDVYTPSIHIRLTPQLHPSLRHELVHALGSDFGFYGLGFHPNMALTEGLAVALAPELRTLDLHEGSFEILKGNKLSSLETLFSPFFWKVAGARSYTISGSLVSYLIERFGSEGVKGLYSGQSIEESFRLDKQILLNDWKQYIDEKSQGKHNAILAEALFRSPGALYERCPHSKPVLQKKTTTGSFLHLRQPVGWNPSKDYHPWLLSLESNVKAVQTTILFNEAREIAGRVYENNNTIFPELKLLDEKIKHNLNVPFKHIEDAELQILKSDLWFPYDRDKSNRLLQELVTFIKDKNLGEVIARQIFARLKVGELFSLVDAKLWRKYLAGWGGLPKRAKTYQEPFSEPWILQYLRLRNHRDKDWRSTDVLRKAFRTELPAELPNIFKEQWYAQLAKLLMKQRDYKLAAQAWQYCAEFSVNGKRQRYEEFSRMAMYFVESRPVVL